MATGSTPELRYMTLGEFLQETRFEPTSSPVNRANTDVGRDESTPEEAQLDVPAQAEIIRNLILKGEYTEVEERLLKFKHKERKEIADFRIDGSSAFFIGCAVNNVNIARFLLDKCSADVERKGTDSPFGWQPNLPLCSPLCCAARHALSLLLIRLLIEHGARKGGVDETGMTAMQIACQTGSLDTVMYLYKHNFSVHDLTSSDKTCLILGVLNPALCRFLIAKGVEVNKQDKHNATALHYAVMDGQLETVKVLIGAGADISIKDKHGLDAILRAASAVQIGIVQYLLTYNNIPTRSKLLAYKLLGSSLADHGKELDAIYWWERSNPGQCEFAKDEYVKSLIANGRKISVGIARSSQPKEELELLERIQAYSVQVKVEIFGLCHPQTYKSLCKLLNINFLMVNLKHCLKLLRYASEVFMQREHIYTRAAPYIASRLLKVFNRIWHQSTKDVPDEDKNIIIHEVLNIISSLVHHVTVCTEEDFRPASCQGTGQSADIKSPSHSGVSSSIPYQQTTEGGTSNPYQASFGGCSMYQQTTASHGSVGSNTYQQQNLIVFEWMCLSLDLICIIRSLGPNEQEDARLINLLDRLLKTNPRGPTDETLLHITVNPNPNYRPYLSTDMVFRCNRYEVARCLLQAGADINAVDANGNTPLFSLLQFSSHWIEDEKHLLQLLLEYGSDIDMKNLKGETSLELLEKASLEGCRVTYQKLQCLAAIQVKRHGLLYKGVVPKRIATFIDNH